MHRRFLDFKFHVTFIPSEVCFVEIPQECGENILRAADEWDRRELAELLGISDDLFDNLN